MTPELYEDAKAWAQKVLAKYDNDRDKLWEYLYEYGYRLVELYGEKYVVWQSERHIKQAQVELADMIIDDLFWDEE